MKPLKLFSAATLLAVFFVISCSQTSAPVQSSVAGVFIATTPCDDVSKKLLHIPLDNKFDMMKWKLELYQDPATLAPTTYKLVCTYGLPRQGTRDFAEGAQTIELKGNWTKDTISSGRPSGVVYTLIGDNSAVSLSFLQVGQNLIHLLDEDRQLMIGNGAWSYTFNRIKPVPSAVIQLSKQNTSLPLPATDSLIVGVFDGRTPCNNELLELNGISGDGCQIIKCRLTLYQDIATQKPTTFQLQTVYVGKGDIKYTSTGKWILTKGIATDPNADVYELRPDSGRPQSISFMKPDDNILFMLDENMHLLVGNEYVSFTLNRSKR